MEVIRVSNKVDVDISWGVHRLPALSSLNDLLKLRACSLDLSTGVTNVLQLLVSIDIYEVIVTGQDCSALIGVICSFESLTVFNALIVLFLFLTVIVVVEARRHINGCRFVPC